MDQNTQRQNTEDIIDDSNDDLEITTFEALSEFLIRYFLTHNELNCEPSSSAPQQSSSVSQQSTSDSDTSDEGEVKQTCSDDAKTEGMLKRGVREMVKTSKKKLAVIENYDKKMIEQIEKIEEETRKLLYCFQERMATLKTLMMYIRAKISVLDKFMGKDKKEDDDDDEEYGTASKKIKLEPEHSGQ